MQSLGCQRSHGRTWLQAQVGHLSRHQVRIWWPDFEPGKLQERVRLRGLFRDWQREGKSVLPLVRLFFVGRGRAGKTTALRPRGLCCQFQAVFS